jgi:hypothetical protein
MCLIKEAKSLERIGVSVPIGCRQLMQLEQRLKHYRSELQFICSKLQRAREQAPKMWMKLLQVHFTWHYAWVKSAIFD